MWRRHWSWVLGLGLVLSVLGVVPASAAPKRKLPDLVVSAASVTPGAVAPGGVLTVRDTTRNKGKRPARATTTRYLLSKNKKLDQGDVRLGERRVKRLRPRRSDTTRPRQVRVPARTKAGRYWLLVCADARSQVRESRERNNCRVVGRRLMIARAPDQPPPGEEPPTDQYRQLPVTARVTVDWRLWQRRSEGGATTTDDQSATFQLETAGLLQTYGGQPIYLNLTINGGTAHGARTYRYQNGCTVQEAELRAASEPIDVASHAGKGFSVSFSHPLQPVPGALGSVRHKFSAVGTGSHDSCGSVSDYGIRLDAEAAHDEQTVVSVSEDLRRITYSFRKDISDTPALQLGQSGTVTIELTIPD